ncbi:MAG: EF-P beta-lysylation protein EpmB [Cycloclasticus sp.]|nr:EF-P beta-lysylation protein EpmB [Cycloclasticus sp.]MBQ0789390.1 EF-P beta-lysylation protein EpmB [Cycloclasticus sp.]
MIMMINVEKNSPTPHWQQELRAAFSNIDDLLAYLHLDSADLNLHYLASKDFPLLATKSYVDRIKKSDWADPLLRQILPLADELKKHPEFLNDPVGDSQASIMPGLLHKYHGRVLLVTTGACAIHCRYCFRRAFPYAANSAHRSQITAITNYLRDNPEITEVILSGGDPLTLSDTKFKHLVDALSDIQQVDRIRIHSRIPVVLPSRITDGFLNTLVSSVKKIIMVIHANHPNELNDEVQKGLLKLKQIGVTLLNQTVLLKGVNDDPGTLTRLSHRLFDCHTLPYYLHLLDKVDGAQHFDLNDNTATAIYQQLQTKLPGYLVPKLVREESGKAYKTPIQIQF